MTFLVGVSPNMSGKFLRNLNTQLDFPVPVPPTMVKSELGANEIDIMKFIYTND